MYDKPDVKTSPLAPESEKSGGRMNGIKPTSIIAINKEKKIAFLESL
jgi:hypothetical protein